MDLNTIDPQDPTFSQAVAQLAQMEADDAAEDAQQKAATGEGKGSATDGDTRTPEAEQAEVQTPDPEPGESETPGAPAEPETQQPETPDPDKEKEKVAPKESQSKFAKNQQRLEGGWKALNERKAELQKQQEQHQAQVAEHNQRMREFEARRAAETKPKFTAEQVDSAASDLERQAKGLEDNGDYEKADRLKFKAEEYREYARELRANPPKTAPSDAQREAEHQRLQKEWWGKAAVDFPNAAKEDSAEGKALRSLIESEPAIVNDPKGLYYAARLVTAETASARVPTLEKELGDLRAKVKALNEKLAVPAGGSARSGHVATKRFEDMSEEEQLSQLQAEAATRGHF